MTHISEEQIDAALHAWNWQSTGVSENEAMKRAIEAALSVPVEGEVGEQITWLLDTGTSQVCSQWRREKIAALLRAFSARPAGVPDALLHHISEAQKAHEAGRKNLCADHLSQAMLFASAPAPQREEG